MALVVMPVNSLEFSSYQIFTLLKKIPIDHKEVQVKMFAHL